MKNKNICYNNKITICLLQNPNTANPLCFIVLALVVVSVGNVVSASLVIENICFSRMQLLMQFDPWPIVIWQIAFGVTGIASSFLPIFVTQEPNFYKYYILTQFIKRFYFIYTCTAGGMCYKTWWICNFRKWTDFFVNWCLFYCQ